MPSLCSHMQRRLAGQRQRNAHSPRRQRLRISDRAGHHLPGTSDTVFVLEVNPPGLAYSPGVYVNILIHHQSNENLLISKSV